MHEQLHLLVSLQDLDTLIKESEDPARKAELESLGFQLTGLEELQKARVKLAGKVPATLLNRYEKLTQHYMMAILPVTGNQCLGCFVTLPTSFFSASYSTELLTCENCGRLLYIP